MDKKIIVYLSFEIFTAGVTEWRVKLNIDLVDFDKYWPLSLSVPSSCLSRLSNWDCIDLRWSFKVSEILSWLESKGTHLRPRNKMRMTRDDMTIWVSRVSKVLFRVKRIQIVKWSGRVGFPCFQDILLLFTVFDKLDLHCSECAVPYPNLIGSTLVTPHGIFYQDSNSHSCQMFLVNMTPQKTPSRCERHLQYRILHALLFVHWYILYCVKGKIGKFQFEKSFDT